MSADSPLFRFQLWRAALPPALRLLLTVNLATYAAFLVLALLSAFGAPVAALLEVLVLPADPMVALVRPWTWLTYGFVNAYGGFFGLISFAFGAYWLNWMGRDYEETYGPHRLFALYVFGTVGAAVVTIALGVALAAVLPVVPFRPAFGLWTPVTAILCAVGTLQPNRQVGLFLLGTVPMKWIAIGFVALSFLFSQDVTVLGAALIGTVFARSQAAGRDPSGWAAALFGGRSRGPAPRSATPSRNPFARTTAGRPARSAPAASSAPLDVDAILDKILEEGYDSLTKEEREALDRASRD